MSKAVNSKWKKTFPDTIGNQNRPATGVDDTQPFETGAFPQYMANDPVRYDLQNAAMSQLMSNDARLKEMVDARGKELDDHKVDPDAHKTGIAGNAATATKVVTTAATGASANIAEASMGGSDSARIRVSGAENAGELALETADDGSEPIVARQYTGIYTTPVRTAKILDESGNTSFPGTVVAPKFTGALNGNAATATKLFTERKINITGNATGSAGFDGTSDVNINVTVNSATKAVNDGNGANIASTYVKKAGDTTTGKITFESTDLNALPEVKKTSDDNMSGIRFSSKTQFLGAVGKRLSNGEDLLNLRSDNTTTDVVLDSRNYGSYALPKSGGNMSGPLNFANATWNLVGDDSYIGDHDITGTFCVKGANGETGIALVNKGNESDYARISYNGGNINFNKTIGGNISGNAASATTAGNVSGKIYYSTDSPSVATDKLFTVKQAHGGDDNVPNNGLVIQTGPTDAAYNGKLYITDNGSDGVWIGGVAAGEEVGWTRLVENKGTWGISITGNAATATTANALNGIINREPATNNHAIIPGAYNRDYCEFHEFGAVWNFIKTSNEDSTTVASIRSDGFHGNVVGNADTATNADKLDGYHASDIISKIQDITPKTAAAIGQFRELVVNDSHQVKLPGGGTWAYFVYTYNSWNGGDSNSEHRTRTGAGIAAGGTVLHTDGNITSNTINAFKLSGTTGAGGADDNNIIVGGFCWRIA